MVGRSHGRLVGKQIIAKYPHLQEVHGYQGMILCYCGGCSIIS